MQCKYENSGVFGYSCMTSISRSLQQPAWAKECGREWGREEGQDQGLCRWAIVTAVLWFLLKTFLFWSWIDSSHKLILTLSNSSRIHRVDMQNNFIFQTRHDNEECILKNKEIYLSLKWHDKPQRLCILHEYLKEQKSLKLFVFWHQHCIRHLCNLFTYFFWYDCKRKINFL